MASDTLRSAKSNQKVWILRAATLKKPNFKSDSLILVLTLQDEKKAHSISDTRAFLQGKISRAHFVFLSHHCLKKMKDVDYISLLSFYNRR